MFKKIAESLAKTAGTSNTQVAFVIKEGLVVDEKYQCGVENSVGMKHQACFAGVDRGFGYAEYGAGITTKDITHMVYDIQNAMKTHHTGRVFTEEELKAAYKIARIVFNLPYLRPLFQNKSFKDAYINGLIIKVVEGTPNAQFFLGPYLIRHIYERCSVRTFIELKKKYPLTIQEAAMLSFFFSGDIAKHVIAKNLEEHGCLSGTTDGHSATSTTYCTKEYLFSIVSGQSPEFHPQPLWGGSPYIIQAMCGSDYFKNRKGTKLPMKVIGEGFSKKHLYNLDQIVKDFLEHKKGLNNAKQA